jgi:imidazolonepropionase-like amidohydrolase
MERRTLIRNARVLTCAGDVLERPADGDILLDGDRVVQVGSGRVDPASLPADTRIIDVRGATVLPGLGDAHTHISWPLDFTFDHAGVAAAPPAAHALDVAAVVRTFVESGYTTIISASVLQPLDDVIARDAIERGLIPGPRIIPGNLLVTSPGAISDGTPMSVVAADASELRDIVAQQCAAGARAIKLFISGDGIVPEFPSDDVYMNDEMLTAAVDEAAKYGAFVTTHARGSASVAMAARTGVRIIHHACFLDDEAVRELENRGDDVWVCPGLHYLYAVVNGHAEPWGLAREKVELSGYRDELKAQVAGLRRLRESGIRIVAGGDFGHQWTRHGTYAAELERYVDLVGMTPTEAIHTATRAMGPLTGLEVGQIRPGYLADLLVVDGDPTEDIAILQDPARRRAVFKGGELAYVNPSVLS